MVSRPVQIASHRGVIQESLVCTARHPTLMWSSQVFDSSTESYRCLFSWTCHDNTSDTVCSCSSHTQPIAAVREFPPIIWRHQPCQICQIADSDRSERRTKQSSQFQSEWTMRCFILMVCYKATRGCAGYFNTRTDCKILEQAQRKWNKVEQSAVFGREILSIWMC